MAREHIGIMGGSFNPIHDRHIQMAVCAKRQFKLDRIIFLPSGNPPHKQEGLESPEDRFEMTRLAICCMEDFEVSRIEIDRDGVIYTVDTLQKMQKQLPDAEFDYIIGEDSLLELEHWRKPEKLFGLCRFLVCCRTSDNLKEHPVVRQLRKKGADIAFLQMPPSEVSSTGIRKTLMQNKPVSDIPPQVIEYIRLTGLYGNTPCCPDVRQIIAKLKHSLSEKRFLHSVLVAYSARELAALHGLDPRQAALAGLLHDCAKCLPLSSMQRIVRECRLLLDKETLQSGNLLHGPVGAAVAEHEYGITDPMILSAIHCHTTGKVGMLPLDMVVFLADKIEPSRRSYPALEELRRLSQIDLGAAMRYSLESTLNYVREQGTEPHPLTQKVADWLKRIAK